MSSFENRDSGVENGMFSKSDLFVEREKPLSKRLKKLLDVLAEQIQKADKKYQDLLRVKLDDFRMFLENSNDPNNIGAHLMIIGKRNAADIKKMLSEKEGFYVIYSNRAGEKEEGMPNKNIKYLTVKRKENKGGV